MQNNTFLRILFYVLQNKIPGEDLGMYMLFRQEVMVTVEVCEFSFVNLEHHDFLSPQMRIVNLG